MKGKFVRMDSFTIFIDWTTYKNGKVGGYMTTPSDVCVFFDELSKIDGVQATSAQIKHMIRKTMDCVRGEKALSKMLQSFTYKDCKIENVKKVNKNWYVLVNNIKYNLSDILTRMELKES